MSKEDLEKGIKINIKNDKKIMKKKHILKSKKKNISTEVLENNSNIKPEENVEELNKNVESKKKEISKRQLKKEKAELRNVEAKEANKQLTAQKALNYVSKWKHIRSEWKFEKLKQIWLIENLFNDKYVSNENFTTILEYFEGCKGLARKQLINKAMEVVKNIEDGIEKDEEFIETEEYKRARELLQALPLET